MNRTVIFSIIILAFGWNTTLAQNCAFIDQLDVDDYWTYTNFNAKGKEESTTRYFVKDKKNIDDSLVVNLETTFSDGKKDSTAVNYDLKCHNNVIYFSMKTMIAQMISEMPDVDLEIEMNDLQFPIGLAVGDNLPNSDLQLSASTNGIQIMTMNVTVTERSVVSNETITTPAGTFECFVITQKTLVKGMMMNKETTSKDWFSLEYGLIKSETYKKNGKLDTYMVMTEVGR